ncbi:7SK snRNA methylphosphate capping enzyme, partial [Caerostris darwini]
MSPPNFKNHTQTSESFQPKQSSPQNISFGKRNKKFYNKNKSFSQQKWSKKANMKEKNKKKDEAYRFRYGNYHQYYGYRNQGQMDSRMSCMKQEWFSGKDVLDVGCNAGHFTLAIAKYFTPSSIIGIDIDHTLIKMAMKNVRHYITPTNDFEEEDFPVSFAVCHGPIAQMMDAKGRYPAGNFPFNVQFVQANFVLPSDELVDMQDQHFDTVLCLSLTKWVHLNWGDIGIKRMFRRIFNLLRPGGNLILEAQLFKSYNKRKNITEEMYQHYNQIELLPEMFNDYLLKDVGFETCDLIDIPAHSSQ